MLQITKTTQLDGNVAAIEVTDDQSTAKDTYFVVLTRSGDLQVIDRWAYRRIENVYTEWQVEDAAGS